MSNAASRCGGAGFEVSSETTAAGLYTLVLRGESGGKI